MPVDSPPIISVRDLTKYYGSTPGVKDINFTVNRGEIFGFQCCHYTHLLPGAIPEFHVGGLSFLKPFNIFYYYLSQKLMYGERSFTFNAIVLTVLISICLTTAIIQFNRRDVPG